MPRAGEVRALLQRPAFTRLLTTRLTSQVSDGVFQGSLASAVLFNPEHQTTAAGLAAALAVVLVPYSLVGPFAGVLLDRWSRQRVLVTANLARAAVVCGTAALMVTTGPTSPALYAAALVAIGINRFYLAALSAALPHTVPAPTLVSANALSTTAGTVVAFLGGGIAVGLRGLIGAATSTDAMVALIAAAGYAVSTLPASGFTADALGPDRPETSSLTRQLATVAADLAAGAHHVAHVPPARRALAVITAHRFCYGISTVVTVLLYRNYFHDHGLLQGGLPGLAEVFAAAGAGTLLAAVATPRRTRHHGKAWWITANLAGAATAEVALGTPFRQDTIVAAAGVLGFAAQAVKICVDTTVQETVADRYLGRVFSLYDMLFNITFVAAAAVAAAWLPPTGRSYSAIAVITAGYAAAAVAFGRTNRIGRVPVQDTWSAAQRRSSSTARS